MMTASPCKRQNRVMPIRGHRWCKMVVIHEYKYRSKRSLARWLGSLWWNHPSQVQVLDMVWAFAFIWIYSRIIYRHYFSGRWCVHQQRDTYGDFVNLKICQLSLSSRCMGSGPIWTCYWTCAPVGNLQVQGSAHTYLERVKGNLRFDPTLSDAWVSRPRAAQLMDSWGRGEDEGGDASTRRVVTREGGRGPCSARSGRFPAASVYSRHDVPMATELTSSRRWG
jgi:hypothetical protein